MTEKIFPPSKKKLKKMADEGNYPFSPHLQSVLFIGVFVAIFYVFSFFFSPGDFFYSLFQQGKVGDIYKIGGIFSLLIGIVWVGIVATYCVGGGKICFAQKKDPNVVFTKWGSLLLFVIFTWILIFFRSYKIVVHDFQSALQLFKQTFWQSVLFFLGASFAFGIIDYFLRRWIFLKNALMTAEEKKEELKEETTAKNFKN